MINIFQITTPTHGTTDIEINVFINDLKAKLRRAKEENKHFDWKCIRYAITKDADGQLWLTGYDKRDLTED